MNSFITWIGGKKALKNIIVSLFPSDINSYIEVFGGAGWVLFHKEKHADKEVYNDFCGDLVNLFRCAKYHCTELQKELSLWLNSREFFNDIREQYKVRGFTDIQRAARYYFMIKTSYGADIKSFGCSKRLLNNNIEYLSDIQNRLNRVVIENKDFEDCIRVYDNEKALFYLDPPYHGTEKYYKAKFKDEDHKRLKECLNSIKGRFILSYNDDKFIRELYKGYEIIEVNRRNNLLERHSDIDKTFKELIIKNF